jgi:nicotinic acid mononucleotide adenylyltransferase
VIIDDYFVHNWKGEMITRDVDLYAREKYGDDIVHIFGTDTLESMPSWDSEQYAAKVVRKLFVPRSRHREERSDPGTSNLDCHVDLSQEQKNLLAMTEQSGIENFEFFTDCHIPDISSTGLREIIPEYTSLKAYYEEEPKFIIPGLSKKISQYILEKRLYRGIGTNANTHTNTKESIKNNSTPSSVSVSPKPKVLVHVCCGPDVTMPILALRDEYEIICFWYDPNIQPKSEHDKRYEAFVKVCEIEGIPYIK